MSRDYSAEWAAVYAAAYVSELERRIRIRAYLDTDDDRDGVARDSAQVADEAVKALHRVRGQEPT